MRKHIVLETELQSCLQDTKVKQRFLSCVDVHPGMTVSGEVTSVEPFGAFLKLADGVKALCPLQHMSELQRTKPSPKFKVTQSIKDQLFLSRFSDLYGPQKL